MTDRGATFSVTLSTADVVIRNIVSFIRDMCAGGRVLVTIERMRDLRTLDQNKLHCALCRDIAKAVCAKSGETFDEQVTEYMRAKTKRKFGVTGTQPDPETGKPEPFLISTTKYSKAQFSKLIEGTLAWALVDLGLDINRPAWADEYKGAR